MHSAVQTAVITTISSKPLSGLNFARYTGQNGSYIPSSPLGVYKPLVKISMSNYDHVMRNKFVCVCIDCNTSYYNGKLTVTT